MTSLSAANVEVGDQLPALTATMTAQKIIAAAAASRDWQPIHHDYLFATETSGLRNIILNAPSQAGWISKFVTDWAGPESRIKSLDFKMRDSICPGDELRIVGEVIDKQDGGACGAWLVVEVVLSVAEAVKTQSEVKLAVPSDLQAENKRAMPWHCPKEAW